MQAPILGRNEIAKSSQRPRYWLDDCRNTQLILVFCFVLFCCSSSLKRPGQALFSTERPIQPGMAGSFPAG